MRGFVVRGVSVAIAIAIAAPSLVVPGSAEAQRRRPRRTATPSGETAESGAPDAQVDAEARALFVAGREAFDAGRYDNALDYFTRAYALSGRPGLLFNIASTSERLRHDAEALRAYEAYLEAMPDAPNREYAQSRIVFLRDQLRADGERPTTVAVPAQPPVPAPRAEARPPAPPPRREPVRLEVTERDTGDDVAQLEAPIAPPAGEAHDREITDEWWFWALVGVGVVGAAAGITAGVVAASSSDTPSAPVSGDFGPGGIIVALEGR